MNSKSLCFSIAAVAMVITTSAPAHAQYDGYNPAKSDRFDGNGRGMRFNFAPTVIKPYGYQQRSVPVAAHQVTHGNVPRTSHFLTGVNPSLFAKSPPPKPILVRETVVSSGVSFPRTQANLAQTFRPEFGRPGVAGRLPVPAQAPYPQRSASAATLLASKPAATHRPTASKTPRYTQSKSVRGTVVPRKQPTPLIGTPQIANYNDTQLYAPGGVMVRSTGGHSGNANVYGKVLSRNNN